MLWSIAELMDELQENGVTSTMLSRLLETIVIWEAEAVKAFNGEALMLGSCFVRISNFNRFEVKDCLLKVIEKIR